MLAMFPLKLDLGHPELYSFLMISLMDIEWGEEGG